MMLAARLEARVSILAYGLCSWLLVLTWSGALQAQVVINEFAYDDSGDDDMEFVELYNAGDETVDLGGWDIGVGSDLGEVSSIDLGPAGSLEAGEFLVVGSPLVPSVGLEVAGFDILPNGPGSLVLRDDEGDAVDVVVYETNKGTFGLPEDALVEGGGIWGNQVLVSGTNFSCQRWVDGDDNDENGFDFGHLPWTPGEPNEPPEEADFESSFEDGAPEDAVAGFPGSFVPARYVDPTLVSVTNPNAVEESPDGGLAMIGWDPAGGGNLIVYGSPAASDVMFEAWVYIDATLAPADESETWSLGLRGTSGTFYNIPVLFEANGNTGVTWTYQRTAGAVTLYLIDEGLGRSAFERPHIAAIPIIAGENDGWQRLRLEAREEVVVGYFGGTYGSDEDGERYEAVVDRISRGSFYIGYREAYANNEATRPVLLDRLVIESLEDEEPEEPRFVRSDVSADGQTNLTDAVLILNFLFLGAETPGCLAAADVDDDGTLLLTDAVLVLGFLFLGGGEPAMPYPDCGEDATADELGCEAFAPCAG